MKSQPTCRFTPSCSSYAVQALSKRGFIVGMILTVGRLLRCQPFCAGGYDPVPERGLKRVKMTALCDENAADQAPKLICEDFVLRRSERNAPTTDRAKD